MDHAIWNLFFISQILFFYLLKFSFKNSSYFYSIFYTYPPLLCSYFSQVLPFFLISMSFFFLSFHLFLSPLISILLLFLGQIFTILSYFFHPPSLIFLIFQFFFIPNYYSFLLPSFSHFYFNFSIVFPLIFLKFFLLLHDY